MKKTKQFILTSVIGGIFFLLPIIVIGVILEKVIAFVYKLQIALGLPVLEGHPLMNNLLAMTFTLLICFFSGLFAKIYWGKKIVEYIEKKILIHIPGYEYSKATAQEVLGLNEHSFKHVVLFQDGEGKYQLGFMVETINSEMSMLFIPSSPKPQEGELLLVHHDTIIETDLTMKQAFTIIKNLGVGSATLLKYCIQENAQKTNGKVEN